MKRKLTLPFLLVFLAPLALTLAQAEEEGDDPVGATGSRSRATRLMQLTGDGDFGDDRTAWDRTYQRKGYVFGKDPAPFLRDNVGRLPKGRALDIAMGEGRNAVFLAKKGFLAEGVDISTVGLRKARRLAAENGVKITAVAADLNKYKITPGRYQVILNFYYLQRSLIPQIKAGLAPGGVVVFEAHTAAQRDNPGARGWDKEFLLEPGELKKAFAEFEILHYTETNDGTNAVASLIAKKSK